MKTVTISGADGREHDVSKAAKRWADNRNKYQHHWAVWVETRNTNDRDLAEFYGTATWAIADTVNDLLGPRRRQRFIKAAQAAYGIER